MKLSAIQSIEQKRLERVVESIEGAGIVDVNCATGFWPFRDHRIRSLTDLHSHLTEEGIGDAFVSPIETILGDDPTDPSDRLVEETAAFEGGSNLPVIHPVPVVSPRFRRWTRSLEGYASNPRVRALKLHPNYHYYSLGDPVAKEFLDAIDGTGLALFVPLRVEDERFHHVRTQVEAVPLSDVVTLAAEHPRVPVVVLNAYRNEIVDLASTTDEVARGADLANLAFDIAYAERNRTIESLSGLPAERLVYGSNTPFFVTRAATMKLTAARIEDDVRLGIASANARRIFGL